MATQPNTTYQTHAVNPIGSREPTLVTKAGDDPINVLVRNVSAVQVFLGTNETDLAPNPSMATYRLGPDSTEVYYLAAKQSLFAIGTGTGGLVSVSASPFVSSFGKKF